MKKHKDHTTERRFFDADLTTDEEKAIFDGEPENSDDELLSEYRSLMLNLRESKLPDEDFDNKMVELLSSDTEKTRVIKILPRIFAVAASILILIAVWFTMDTYNKPVYGTITDPEVAFAQTKSALMIVSDKLNEGIKPASSTIKKVDKGIKNSKNLKKAGETINNIKKFNKLNKTEDLLKSMTKVTVKAG